MKSAHRGSAQVTMVRKARCSVCSLITRYNCTVMSETKIIKRAVLDLL